LVINASIPIQHHLIITTRSTPSIIEASKPSNMVSRTAGRPTKARRAEREGHIDTADNICDSLSTQRPKVLLLKRTFAARMTALSVPTHAVFGDRQRRKVRYSESTTKSIAPARQPGIGEGRQSMRLFLSSASATSPCLSSAGARNLSGSVFVLNGCRFVNFPAQWDERLARMNVWRPHAAVLHLIEKSRVLHLQRC
jgi:hypothetical protein